MEVTFITIYIIQNEKKNTFLFLSSSFFSILRNCIILLEMGEEILSIDIQSFSIYLIEVL